MTEARSGGSRKASSGRTPGPPSRSKRPPGRTGPCGGALPRTVVSSWVFGLGRGTAVPLEILGRGTGCGPARFVALGWRRRPVRMGTFFMRTDPIAAAGSATPAPQCVMGAACGQPRALHEVLQRVWWAGDGKGRPRPTCCVAGPRPTPRAVDAAGSPNSARTCLSTHNKRLARWFVF